MDATTELTDLAARIAQLPDDAQLELAWQVLRRFGYRDGPDPEWEAGMKADIEALLEWERAGGRVVGDYRAAG